MPRPFKKRFICQEPKFKRFNCINNNEKVTLTVDEFEVIRLIDFESLTQLECAEQMQVARTTVQSMYDKARKIIADALVNGKQIIIEGGEYQLCEYYQSGCKHSCGKKCQLLNLKNEKKGLNNMKTFIAVTYENGNVFQHFGHTEEVKIYEIEDKKIVSSKILSTTGYGHGALATFLKNNKVDVLICGGIGGGAQAALMNANISFFGGVTGKADEVVEAYVKGTLEYNPDVKCNNHENHSGHHHSCSGENCAKEHC